MYAMLNEAINLALDDESIERDLLKYSSIMTRFAKGSIAEDATFQRAYRGYWAMNGARLSTAFLDRYFRLMDERRGDTAVEIEEVVNDLWSVPTHRNGRKSVQFSFASKLVHTVDPTKPIFDSLVCRFYFLPDPSGSADARLAELVTSYRFLQHEHRRVVDGGLLEPGIRSFRDRFAAAVDGWTDQRVIDVLIWAFVKYLRAGALRRGTVRYG